MSDPIHKSVPHADPLWVEHGYGTRFQGFQNLMRLRIRDVLLVSSLYDLYVFEEDGRLYELIREKYKSLNLSHVPELTRVSNGKEAIALVKEEPRFDLIITTNHIEDMRPATFSRKLKEEGIHIPVVLLAFDNRELSDMLLHDEASAFDQIFIWLGDFRLILAIIKHLEDLMNVDHDTQLVGVQSLLVVEDNIRYYSYFLPIIFLETMRQSQRLISEGINLSHKQLRQRARPKILLCKNYEEAWAYFEKYQDTMLGIISDIDFPRNGKPEPEAGIQFAMSVKEIHPDIPILLNSTLPSNEVKAKEIGCSFLLKDAPSLIQQLNDFMSHFLSFGDFIFRTPDGKEVGRADDLFSLEEQLRHVPEESIRFHAERNHFSNWLKARTEFWLAHQLRPRKVSDFPSIAILRNDLIASLQEYRKIRQRGIVTDFKKESFDPYSSISRIGEGSLGGKARGLSFVNILINNYKVQNRFDGVQIFIPPAVVIGTDVFDQFIDENNLRLFALQETDDMVLIKQFIGAKKFPQEILGELASFLDVVKTPLAVRSSSLLEDSHNHPFAGVYKTLMLPNSHPDAAIRLAELIQAIKLVYASTYSRAAKDYIHATSYRQEDEKMAVIIQKMVGTRHHDRFYPDFSGVARSFNFYPIAPQTPSDGIIAVALGLGKMVVEGGSSVRFSPKYPGNIVQFSNTKSILADTQKEFFALNVKPDDGELHPVEKDYTERYPLEAADQDGTLSFIGSTYSAENDRIVDGTSRNGVRLVTFAPILKQKVFPLCEILDLLLDMGGWGMGTPVEIEFAVNLSVPKGHPREFSLLQMRPMVLNRDLEVLNIEAVESRHLVCQSKRVLGNGVIDNICDIVLVDRDRFDRAKSRAVAQEIADLNSQILSQDRRYLLVVVGRLGSMDPWLGIPVTWDQISGARAIIEAEFRDFSVEPSQGSHFFQNLNSFLVGYFTIRNNDEGGFIDWDWLLTQKPVQQMDYTRHLRFEKPVVIKMSGHLNKGIILKPEK
jgi:CheY-like chemotaxis protein